MSTMVPAAVRPSRHAPKKDELMASITGVLNDNAHLKKNASVKDIQQAIAKENPEWKVSEKKVKKYIKKNNLAELKDDDTHDDVSVASSVMSSASQRLKSLAKRSPSLNIRKSSILRRSSRKALPPISVISEVKAVENVPHAEQAPMRPVKEDGTETEENFPMSPVGKDQGTVDTDLTPSLEGNVDKNSDETWKDNAEETSSLEQKERDIDTADAEGGENKEIIVGTNQALADATQTPSSKDTVEEEIEPKHAEDKAENDSEEPKSEEAVSKESTSQNNVEEKSRELVDLKENEATVDGSPESKEHELFTSDADGEEKEMICAGCIIL